MLESVQQSTGEVGTPPLKYRWKGVERLTCTFFRGRRQHDVWLRSMQVIWRDAKVKKPAEQLERVSIDGVTSNETSKYKADIRGGRTVDFMRRDLGAMQLERTIVLNTGVQMYLNKCLAADGVVTKYSQALLYVPNDCVVNDHELPALRSEAIRRNLDLLLGKDGLEVLVAYCQYFDFDAPDWSGWSFDDDAKFTLCLDMIVVMQDVAYRCIFKLDIPNYQILEACKVPVVDADYDDGVVVRAAKRLHEKSIDCSKCGQNLYRSLGESPLGIWRTGAQASSHCAWRHRRGSMGFFHYCRKNI